MNGSFLESDDDDMVLADYDDEDFASLGGFGEDDDDAWEKDSEAVRRNWPRYRANTGPARPASARAGFPILKIGKVA